MKTYEHYSNPASRFRLLLPFWRQLRWSLIFSFACLAILPILAVEGMTIPRIRSEAQTQVANQLTSISRLKRNQITRWLQDNRAAVAMLLSEPVSRDLKGFLREPTGNLQRQSAVNVIFREAIAKQDTQLLKSLFLFLPDGRIVAASNDAEIGKLVNRQPYFAKSLESDYIQPPYYGVGSNELVIVMTRRLLDDNGQLLGVLGVQPNLAVLSDIMLERTGLGESGETYLVSQESNYLLTPSRFPGHPLTQAYYSTGIERGLRGEEGVDVYGDYRTPPVPVIGAYQWIPELQAAMMAEVDVSEALLGANRAQLISITLSLAAIVIAVLIGFYTATRISRPIVGLTEAAGQIADGDLDRRVSVGQHNEIGTLAEAFNSMATRLQQTLVGLEDEVAERTLDLQRALLERERTLEQLQASLDEGEALRATVRNLSSPVLPVLDGVLVMPLIGTIDTDRATLLMQSLLTAVAQHKARVAIIDVTGVPIVDTQVAQALIRAATAARLLGAQTLLVGLRPELAQTIVGLGVDLTGLVTHADLQSGIRYALQLQQRRAA